MFEHDCLNKLEFLATLAMYSTELVFRELPFAVASADPQNHEFQKYFLFEALFSVVKCSYESLDANVLLVSKMLL